MPHAIHRLASPGPPALSSPPSFRGQGAHGPFTRRSAGVARAGDHRSRRPPLMCRSPPANQGDQSMQQPIDSSLPPVSGAPSRRTFLRGAGLVGAGAAAAGVLGVAAQPALAAEASAATGSGKVDPEDPRFTIAVIPDTQYLFDADRGDPAPLTASLRYILDHREEHNIVFAAHLGDVVENAAAAELAAAGKVFDIFDKRKMPYSVLAGNHDIDSRTDDQRGPSAVPRRLPAVAVRATADVRRCDAGRLQHLPPGPGRRPGVADLRAGLAGLGRHDRLGEAGPAPRTRAPRRSSPPTRSRPPTPPARQPCPGYGQSLWNNLISRQRPDLPDPQRALLAVGAHRAHQRRRSRRARARHRLPGPLLRRQRDDPALPLRPGPQHDRRGDLLAVDPRQGRRAAQRAGAG